MPGQDEREFALKEREVELRAQELELKRTELRRSRWINPLVFALLAATVAAFGNLAVAWWNGREQHSLEAQKAEAQRVLAMIQTGDPDKAATNLQFLLDTRLYSDPRKELATSLANRRPGQGPSLPANIQPIATPPEAVLFDNWNGDAIAGDPARPSPPPQPTEFKVPRDIYVTYLSNYHWNIGPGKAGARIYLVRQEDGVQHALCNAVTSAGQNDKPDVNWFCRLSARIPAGTYRVIDSDPGTWSHNAKSENRGFSRVRGYPAD